MAYADGDVLVRAVMTNVSGLLEDEVVNDFAFHSSLAPDAAAKTAIFTAVSDFYRVVQPIGNSVGMYIGSQINRAATHRLDMYKIQAGPLGSPIASIPWLGPPTVGAALGTNLPNEVAGVLSFFSEWEGSLEESGTTRPRARRRGRVYIGPLVTGALNPTGNPKLENNFTLTLRQAGVALMDAIDPGGGSGWGVWSRADQVVRKVIGGFTNDAPDTQRRRGQAPVAKVLWGGDPGP